MKKIYTRLPLLLCLLIGIAFSIKSLREPDLWWQIRTGEWILENKKVPTQDIFSYTYEGTKWINVKWGFEVIAAVITKISGPESIFLLQALFIFGITFLLIKIARKILPQNKDSLVIPLAVFLTLLGCEYRIIGRPEMISHFFSVFFIYLLIDSHQKPSRKIFWLIPLQILWANLHEAFGTGVVISAMFFAGEWLQYFLWPKFNWLQKKDLPKNISIVLPLQVLGIIINPIGFSLLLHPFNILSQVYDNKYSTELFNALRPEFWQWNTYYTLSILTLSLVGLFVKRKGKKKSDRFDFINPLSIGLVISVFAFTYLAATAYRNIIFLQLIIFPILVLSLFNFQNYFSLFKKYQTQITTTTTVFLFAFYISIVSGYYYEWTKSRDRFGLEILSSHNPVGAAEFVAQNNLKGTCFSDYLTSSYLLWRLQPDFKTFIDLRDLDVFPTDFFGRFSEAVTFPDSFDKLDSTYHFNYIVLFRPQFANLHNHLYGGSVFKPVFVDGVAAVYVRRQDSDTSKDVRFSGMNSVKPSALSVAINKILNPFYHSMDYKEIDNDALASTYFICVDRFDLAEKHALKASTNHIEDYRGFQLLGEIYYNKALSSPTVELKNQNLLIAATNYQQSLSNQSDAGSYLGLGAVYYQLQNYPLALENLSECIKHDKMNLSASNLAAECCKNLANTNPGQSENYIKQAIEYFKRSDKLNPDNPPILLNLGFLYYRINDCANSRKFLQRVDGFEGLSETDKANIRNCLKNCEGR